MGVTKPFFSVRRASYDLSCRKLPVVVLSKGLYLGAVLRNKAKRRMRAAIIETGFEFRGKVFVLYGQLPDSHEELVIAVKNGLGV